VTKTVSVTSARRVTKRLSGTTSAATLDSVTKSLFSTCLSCGASITNGPMGRPRKYCPEPECQRAAHAARTKAARQRRKNRPPVTTVIDGKNDDLIATVASLYLNDGDTVADVTYSSGRFWRKVKTENYRFLASDLIPMKPGVISADFRTLPYRDDSLDALVFDPPYIHSPGKGMLKDRYNGLATTDMITYADIMKLYQDGMTEACRVLRDGGQLWVKCKDSLASERQRWSHITIYGMAQELGMYPRDLFLLIDATSPTVTTGRWARQLHARKVHSYLWIFETGGYRRRG